MTSPYPCGMVAVPLPFPLLLPTDIVKGITDGITRQLREQLPVYSYVGELTRVSTAKFDHFYFTEDGQVRSRERVSAVAALLLGAFPCSHLRTHLCNYVCLWQC